MSHQKNQISASMTHPEAMLIISQNVVYPGVYSVKYDASKYFSMTLSRISGRKFNPFEATQVHWSRVPWDNYVPASYRFLHKGNIS